MNWRKDYNAWPPADDDNDYFWDVFTQRWEIFRDEPEVDDDAIERADERRRKRAEWDHYHPGEPCPEIELD